MLRGEGVICGTSTTGTGTLTFAATPAPPGGADFYQWLTATGVGFANGNAVLVPYVIIEYTDATFATAKQQEVGVGTVTLGASLAATTLARTTVQMTGLTLNATATYGVSAPSAINIGTAANTLIFVGASAANVAAYSPYYETALNDALGVNPLISAGAGSSQQPTNGTDIYMLFEWRVPMLVKRASIRVTTAYSGTTGAAVSTVYARLYAVASNGRPGKLLYDFGTFGTNPLNATGNISSGAGGNGFNLLPGVYFFDLLPAYSGATGTVVQPKINTQALTAVSDSRGRLGSISMSSPLSTTATGGAGGAGPDPANTTGYATNAAALAGTVLFALAPS